MTDTGSGHGRRYTRLYWAAFVSCWIGGGIMATAAGLLAAQCFPGSALLWVWGTVTAAVAVAPVMLSDRAAAAWARAVLIRGAGGRSCRTAAAGDEHESQ
jgi:hypothetical protein